MATKKTTTDEQADAKAKADADAKAKAEADAKARAEAEAGASGEQIIESLDYAVKTPNAFFEGERLGVTFRDGEARCTKAEAEALHAAFGYTITEA